MGQICLGNRGLNEIGRMSLLKDFPGPLYMSMHCKYPKEKSIFSISQTFLFSYKASVKIIIHKLTSFFPSIVLQKWSLLIDHYCSI